VSQQKTRSPDGPEFLVGVSVAAQAVVECVENVSIIDGGIHTIDAGNIVGHRLV
jgi:hypothetical protein